ncbi:MAG: hypothetical protein AB7O67_17905 [Vicinamibacterales bacterium]
MVLPVIGKLSMGSFGVGAAAAVVGAAVARPLLVGVVRAGYDVSDVVTDAWAKAKSEAQAVKNEALAAHTSANMENELETLRAEVASLRQQVAGKRSS